MMNPTARIALLETELENALADLETAAHFQKQAENDRRRADWLLDQLQHGAIRYDGDLPLTPVAVLDAARTRFAERRDSVRAKNGRPQYSAAAREAFDDALSVLEDIVSGRYRSS